jgi:hypothetical protein
MLDNELTIYVVPVEIDINNPQIKTALFNSLSDSTVINLTANCG